MQFYSIESPATCSQNQNTRCSFEYAIDTMSHIEQLYELYS